MASVECRHMFWSMIGSLVYMIFTSAETGVLQERTDGCLRADMLDRWWELGHLLTFHDMP
jgi:hypothetical protein